MKEAYTHLARLLQVNSFTKVLDLGAWKWYGSLLAASYRTTVDAVDNGSMPMRAPPSFLLDHKYITYFKEDITSYLGRYTGDAYDMVLMLNVLHFLWNNYLNDTLLPFFGQAPCNRLIRYHKLLSRRWSCLLFRWKSTQTYRLLCY